MTILDLLSSLDPLDMVALVLLWSSWFLLGWVIEHPGRKRPSVTVLMADYRRAWMRELVTREPRIFDASILSNLRQGTAFFASACMIAIGGVVALIGNTETLRGVAEDLSVEPASEVVWEIKLLVVVFFLTHAFLKFVWSNRLFGYCAVMMAAVPNEIHDQMAYPRAAQAAEINIRAAWNFNRGLRSIYYAMGSLAWLLGSIALIIATCLVAFLIWQREFASKPRDIILSEPLDLTSKIPVKEN